MPDISMCASSGCPLASGCYRSAASGTKPTERRQSWSAFTWVFDANGLTHCHNYWPNRPLREASHEGRR